MILCYPLTDTEIARLAASHAGDVAAGIRAALALAELRPEMRKLPPAPPAPPLTWGPGTIVVEADPAELASRSFAGPHAPATEDDGA